MPVETEHDTYIYDEVQYPSYSYSLSHPSHLATLATLLGMNPPPVAHCRVLELGCASGGNLIPMAYGLPESEFVGIDLSACQVAEGQAMLAAVGAQNVTLKHMDILDVDADLGQFDYIIAHGVYSWVPRAVQEKVLEICRKNLAPNGVAYVSYNTYPGWHMLGAVRTMMLYHTRGVTDPARRAAEARGLVDFLATSVSSQDGTHTGFMNAYLNYVKEYLFPKEDAFLLHDELSDVNEPLYFYQFAGRATRHGLRYLADAEFQTMLASNLTPEVAEALRHMAKDTITLEQYIDFIRNRTFRQSLLCHQEVKLKVDLGPQRLADFYVASSAKAESPQPDIHSAAVEKFEASDGAVLATDHPVTKSAMLCLAEVWPKSVPFKILLATARARLGGDLPEGGRDAQVLAANLLRAYSYSGTLVELQLYAPQFVLEVSERPVASPVARFQAKRRHKVTNLRHEPRTLGEVSRHLLPYLDGSRDRRGLLSLMHQWAAEGIIQVGPSEEQAQDTEPESEPDRESALARLLESNLRPLAGAALLVS